MPVSSISSSIVCLDDFVKKIRQYKKSSIVNVGTKLLWKLFRKRRLFSQKEEILLLAYCSRIVLLASATANDYRSKEISEEDFCLLLNDYLNIYGESQSNNSIDQEIKLLLSHLKQTSDRTEKIPEHYLIESAITEAFKMIPLSKVSCSQKEVDIDVKNTLASAWRVFEILEEKTKATKAVSEISKKVGILNIER